MGDREREETVKGRKEREGQQRLDKAPAGAAVGGSEPFRSYWEMYLSRGLLLVFVVDSADHRRLPEAKKHLHQLIETNPIIPLVVFANKQDLEAAYHITDIHEALALSEVGNDRKMFLFGTQVTENGSEIPSTMQDAKDLIAHLAADMQ
ncbi:ADP-ribosylation factor-like protein 9 isoform 2-T2 [Hipposideros larvatus]